MKTYSIKNLCYLICFIILSVTFITSPTYSQVTITLNDFQKIFTPGGTHYYINSSGQTNINIGKTGGPNIYDFSFITFQSASISNNYYVKDIPELASRYDGDGVAIGETPSTIENNPIFLFRNDTAYVIGQATVTTPKEYIHYIPYEIAGVFPTVYQWTVSQPVQRFDTTYDSNNQVASANLSSSTEITTIDGYGTLKINGGEYQCIRVKKDHSGYGDKEFIYMTKEGIFLNVGLMPESEADTGVVSSNYMVLIASALVGIESEKTIPIQYRLSQNFPNPFNPTTQIQYDIPKATFVRLSVYNVLGQEVAELVNGQQTAGKYVTTFNGSKLTSGIYFYRLQAGNFVQTKKLVLMK